MARLLLPVLALLSAAAPLSLVYAAFSAPPPLHAVPTTPPRRLGGTTAPPSTSHAVPTPPRRLSTTAPPAPSSPAAALDAARAEYEAAAARLDAIVSCTYVLVLSVFVAGAVLGWHVAVMPHGIRPAGTCVCRYYDWSSVAPANNGARRPSSSSSSAGGGDDSGGVKPVGRAGPGRARPGSVPVRAPGAAVLPAGVGASADVGARRVLPVMDRSVAAYPQYQHSASTS